ncbi:MAG: hypothetical protein Q9201_002331 [Fulgogasparrea decipioides]
MRFIHICCFILSLSFCDINIALRFDIEQLDWNLIQNKTAAAPLDYWGQWQDHTYQASPENWRFPSYTITIDRFVDGDPANDDINGTAWEHDITETQLRFGATVGKHNFFIPGEIVGGNQFGSVYMGRGKEPSMAEPDAFNSISVTRNTSNPAKYLRDKGRTGFDSAAFHYTIYRNLKRLLGEVFRKASVQQQPSDAYLALIGKSRNDEGNKQESSGPPSTANSPHPSNPQTPVTPNFPDFSTVRDFAGSGSATQAQPPTAIFETRQGTITFGSSGGVTPIEHPTVDNHRFRYGTVLQGKKDYALQNVEPFFTDPTGLYYKAFTLSLKT